MVKTGFSGYGLTNNRRGPTMDLPPHFPSLFVSPVLPASRNPHVTSNHRKFPKTKNRAVLPLPELHLARGYVVFPPPLSPSCVPPKQEYVCKSTYVQYLYARPPKRDKGKKRGGSSQHLWASLVPSPLTHLYVGVSSSPPTRTQLHGRLSHNVWTAACLLYSP